MSTTRRLIRLGLVSVVLASLGGMGYLLYRSHARRAPARALRAGAAAYGRGEQALVAGNAAEAIPRFEEALRHANRALADLKEQGQADQAPQRVAQLVPQIGQAYYLKARALRDEAYSRALAEGSPLPLLADPNGAVFRSASAIPDADLRTEAVRCLREAAQRLTGDKGVQEEALRTESALQPIAWDQVERWAGNLLDCDARNPRALFLLAHIELEQPRTDGKAGPAPKLKRDRQRVLKSLDYLARLKEVDDYPLWRALHLEARARLWLRDDSAARGQGDEKKRADVALRALAEKAQREAQKLPSAGEKLAPLSDWDIQGVFNLRLLALDLALEDARKPQGDRERPLALLGGTLRFCEKMAGVKGRPIWLELSALTALRAVVRVEPFVRDAPPPQWRGHIDTVQALARKARGGKVVSLSLYTEVARLLVRESAREGKSGNPGPQAQRDRQALQWVEEGLRLGTQARVPPEQLIDLHALAGEVKVLRGARADALAPHLQALKAAHKPQGDAFAALIEGALAEREGRLEKARRYVEKALRTPGANLGVRPHLMLANLYLALGQPEQALTSLRQLEHAYQRFGLLSAREKAWATQLLGGREDMTALLLRAHLDTARQRIIRELRLRPGPGRAALAAARENEEAVRKLIAQLPPRGQQAQAARQALATYYAGTGRPDLARQELDVLRKDHPASLGVLRIEVELLAQAALKKEGPGPRRFAAADQRVREFLAENPRDVSARLFWAEWLVRTGRAGEAVSYLRSPDNFPGALSKDERYQRVLAVALLNKGDRAGGLALLRHLPEGPLTDVLLFPLLDSAGEKEEHLRKALARHENNGLLRCFKAGLALEQGKYEEAARGYAGALELTRVKPLARQGLSRALFALAERDPRKVRALAGELLEARPGEPVLYLAHAYASLLLNDVGARGDRWETQRNMASALAQCEQALTEEGQSPVVGPLVSAELWMMANRPDQAHAEVVRATKEEPKNLTAALLGLRLALVSDDPEVLAEGRKHLAVLKEAQPGQARTVLLEAQLQEREGKKEDAQEAYERLVEKHPREGAGHAGLVVLLERKGQKQEARKAVRNWQRALPHDVGATRARVRQLAEEGKIAAAEKEAEDFLHDELERERDRPAPVGAQAKAWAQQREARLKRSRAALEVEMARGLAGGKALAEGEKWVRRALADQPDLEGAQLVLGDLYVMRKEWVKAKDHYESMLKQHKGHGMVGNNLAWVLAVHLDDAAGAQRIIQGLLKGRFDGKTISGERLSSEFLDTIGVVAGKLRRPEVWAQARDLLEAARRRYPRDARIYLHLGEAYAALGQASKAREMLGMALDRAAPDARGPLNPAQREEVLASARARLKALGEPVPPQ